MTLRWDPIIEISVVYLIPRIPSYTPCRGISDNCKRPKVHHYDGDGYRCKGPQGPCIGYVTPVQGPPRPLHWLCNSSASALKAPASAGYVIASAPKAPASATQCQNKAPQGPCDGHAMPMQGRRPDPHRHSIASQGPMRPGERRYQSQRRGPDGGRFVIRMPSPGP